MLKTLAIVLSLIGVAISTYLLYSTLNHTQLECGISSCGVVNDSKYANFFSIPVAAWGLAYYLGILILLFINRVKWFFYATIVGVAFSAYLTFIEAFVIKAWCQWCVLSAWIALALVVIAYRMNIKQKRENKRPDDSLVV